MGEIVLYIPAGGHRATAYIARGAAIVGEPRAGSEDIEICVEDAIFGPGGMRMLAERARYAAGQLLGCCPSAATRVVPREALVAVGTFDLREGRIGLTGPDSEGAVAAWLGTLRLDPAELAQRPRGCRTAADVAHLVPDVSVAVNGALGLTLIRRGGLRREGEEWVDPDGRRTSASAEALIWALVLIAGED